MASVDGNAASGTNGSMSGDSGHTSSTVNIKSEPDYSSATNVDDDANAGPAKAPYIPPTGKVDPEKLQKYQFTAPPDCPVFHPTAAEFSMGPIEYINKIRPAAEKYGICKIIIPKCHPLFPFSIDIEKFHFTPRNQRLSELEASTRAYLHFNERLYKFWELQGLTIKHPTLEKKFIDFYELHRLVREEGGYDMVTRDKKWQKICLKMNYAKHNSSTLRSYYEKYLYSYDLFLIGATRPHRKQETKANIIHNNNNNDNDKKISSPTHGNDAEAVKTTEQEVVKEEEAIESSEREAKKGEDGGQDEKNFKQNLLPQNEKQPYQQQRRQQQQQPQAPIVHHSELRKLQTFGAGPRMPGMFSFAIDDPMKQSGKGKVCHQCGVMQFNPLNSHNFLTCAKCDISYHRLCVFPPLNDAPKGPWNCQSCIAERLEEHAQYFAKNFGFSVSGKTFNLMEFGEMADKFKRDYFDMQPEDIPLEMVEKEFWRILSTRLEYNPLIVEYGADLHTNHYGSGFPTRDNRLNNDMTELIESPWNLNNLPTLSGSVFRHINTNINGMVIPWMYVGMCFSAFCWHNEDHWTYSINYLHWGEPKIWYGVPGDKAEVFEEAMKKIVPNLFEEQPDLLHLLVTTCNPNVLVQHNVPIYKATQEAGQFIVTFPRSYHAGFNQGFNFAEAVNFAPPDWIPIGRQSMVNYSLHRRYPVFAHDELICKMSDHPNNLTDRLLEATYHDLLTMIETEKRERRRAAEMGINRSEFCRFETKIDDERQCQFCCTTCFTLAVRCPCCENKLACLPHFDKLCVCGKCEADNFVLLYRYTMSELRIIKHQLENFMAQRKRWSKSTEALLKATRYEEKVSIDQMEKLVMFARENGFDRAAEPFRTLAARFEEAIETSDAAHNFWQRYQTAVDHTTSSAPNAANKMELEQLQYLVKKIKACKCLVQNHEHIINTFAEAQSIDSLIRSYLCGASSSSSSSSNSSSSSSSGSNGAQARHPKADKLKSVIDRANKLKMIQFEPQLSEITKMFKELQWLEWYEAVFRGDDDDDHASSIEPKTLRELSMKGIAVPSKNPAINRALEEIQKAQLEYDAWISKVTDTLKRQDDDNRRSSSSSSSNHKHSLEFMQRLVMLRKTQKYLKRLNLEPAAGELAQAVAEAEHWSRRAKKLHTQISNAYGNAAKMPPRRDVEAVIAQYARSRCVLPHIDTFDAMLRTVNSWIESLARTMNDPNFVRYRAVDALLRPPIRHISRSSPLKLDHPGSSEEAAKKKKTAARTASAHEAYELLLRQNDHSPMVDKLSSGDCHPDDVRRLYDEHVQAERTYFESIRAANRSVRSIVEQRPQSQSPDLARRTFCFCGDENRDEYLVECQACLDWYHLACVDEQRRERRSSSSAAAAAQSSKSQRSKVRGRATAAAPVTLDRSSSPPLVDTQFMVCCLCTTGRTPTVKQIDLLAADLKRISIRFLEGELFKCFHDRLQQWQRRFRQALDDFPELKLLYDGATTDIELITEESQKILDDLLLDVAILGVSMPEIAPLWRISVALNKYLLHFNATKKTVIHFNPLTVSKRSNKELPITETRPKKRKAEKREDEKPTCKSTSRQQASSASPPQPAAQSNGSSASDSITSSGKCKAKRNNAKNHRQNDKEEEEEEGEEEEEEEEEDPESADYHYAYETCALGKGCRRPNGKHLNWVKCDHCDQWYHQICQDITEPSEVKEGEDFFCKKCQQTTPTSSSAAATNSRRSISSKCTNK